VGITLASALHQRERSVRLCDRLGGNFFAVGGVSAPALVVGRMFSFVSSLWFSVFGRLSLAFSLFRSSLCFPAVFPLCLFGDAAPFPGGEGQGVVAVAWAGMAEFGKEGARGGSRRFNKLHGFFFG
jgi:hypothetical protein